MESRFIVERGDSSFILYAGLLAEAHAHGLQSIVTHLQQAPTPENGMYAIVSAAVTVEIDGVTKLFTGIGDASPASVKPNMQNCILRLAETRAKARALRDAVNVTMCSVEEMDEYESHEEPKPRRRQASPQLTPTPPAVRPSGNAAPLRSVEGGKCPYCATTGKFHRPDCPANPASQRTA